MALIDQVRVQPYQDRRRKLSTSDKNDIAMLYKTQRYTQTELARIYNVNRKTIYKIVIPGAAERNRRYNQLNWYRFDEMRTQDERTESIAEHRDYKRSLVSDVKDQNTTVDD